MIIALEWSSFVCTHSRGANWKGSFERAPWLVTKVMDNGMRFCDLYEEDGTNDIIIRILYSPWYSGDFRPTCSTSGIVHRAESTIWTGIGEVPNTIVLCHCFTDSW